MAYGDIALTKEIAGNIATTKPNRARTHKQLDDRICCKEAWSLSRLYEPLLEVKQQRVHQKYQHNLHVKTVCMQVGGDLELTIRVCCPVWHIFQISRLLFKLTCIGGFPLMFYSWTMMHEGSLCHSFDTFPILLNLLKGWGWGSVLFPLADIVHVDLLSAWWRSLDIPLISNSDVPLRRPPGVFLFLTQAANSP